MFLAFIVLSLLCEPRLRVLSSPIPTCTNGRIYVGRLDSPTGELSIQFKLLQHELEMMFVAPLNRWFGLGFAESSIQPGQMNGTDAILSGSYGGVAYPAVEATLGPANVASLDTTIDLSVTQQFIFQSHILFVTRPNVPHATQTPSDYIIPFPPVNNSMCFIWALGTSQLIHLGHVLDANSRGYQCVQFSQHCLDTASPSSSPTVTSFSDVGGSSPSQCFRGHKTVSCDPFLFQDSQFSNKQRALGMCAAINFHGPYLASVAGTQNVEEFLGQVKWFPVACSNVPYGYIPCDGSMIFNNGTTQSLYRSLYGNIGGARRIHDCTGRLLVGAPSDDDLGDCRGKDLSRWTIYNMPDLKFTDVMVNQHNCSDSCKFLVQGIRTVKDPPQPVDNRQQLIYVRYFVVARGSSPVVGTILASFLPYSEFDTNPARFIPCDGRELEKSAYPALFNLLQSLSADFIASGTRFLIPNCRERVPVGAGPAQTGSGQSIQPAVSGGEMKGHNFFTLSAANIDGNNLAARISTTISVYGSGCRVSIQAKGNNTCKDVSNMMSYIGVYFYLQSRPTSGYSEIVNILKTGSWPNYHLWNDNQFAAASVPGVGSVFKQTSQVVAPMTTGVALIVTDGANPLGVILNQTRNDISCYHINYLADKTIDWECCPQSKSPSNSPSMSPSQYPSQSPLSTSPTEMPSDHPSKTPSQSPSTTPSKPPSHSPTINPTNSPSNEPTVGPTNDPTNDPTREPSANPSSSPSFNPTFDPTGNPTTTTRRPVRTRPPAPLVTGNPTTARPTQDPTLSPIVTVNPTQGPTGTPSTDPTRQPTQEPTSGPTTNPTKEPTQNPSSQPSMSPSNDPSSTPSQKPSQSPSASPTQGPSSFPSGVPSDAPTTAPSDAPSDAPTDVPTLAPTAAPSDAPSDAPTVVPTVSPTSNPSTSGPTPVPSNAPTNAPSASPTTEPSDTPTAVPSDAPTVVPTVSPTNGPSNSPSSPPSQSPTRNPSSTPTDGPTMNPSNGPSVGSTGTPTVGPSPNPSSSPQARTLRPSNFVTGNPTTGRPTQHPSLPPVTQTTTNTPTSFPSLSPSWSPSIHPSDNPSGSPANNPSRNPTRDPAQEPTLAPSDCPSVAPTSVPSDAPTTAPTSAPTKEPAVLSTPSPSLCHCQSTPQWSGWSVWSDCVFPIHPIAIVDDFTEAISWQHFHECRNFGLTYRTRACQYEQHCCPHSQFDVSVVGVGLAQTQTIPLGLSHHACDGAAVQFDFCSQCIPVDGQWSEWCKWGACINGIRTRTRTCTEPASSCGGRRCDGNSTQVEVCESCYWTRFGKWSSCLNGEQSRSRFCVRSDNDVGDAPSCVCHGPRHEIRPCDPAHNACLAIDIHPDNHQHDVTWEVLDMYDSSVTQGLQQAAHDDCVPVVRGDAYFLKVYDAFGDGICCEYGQGNFSWGVDGIQLGKYNRDENWRVKVVAFTIPPAPKCFQFEVHGKNIETENSWFVSDGQGSIVASGNTMTSDMRSGCVNGVVANSSSTCFTFHLHDSNNNGICCNPLDGTGSIKLFYHGEVIDSYRSGTQEFFTNKQLPFCLSV